MDQHLGYDGAAVPGSRCGAGAAPSGVGNRVLDVLIVDDDEECSGMIKTCLVLLGYRVGTARHGNEALQKLCIEPVRLVLTDIFMPEIDGLELIIHLRNARRDLPVIAMSGNERHGGMMVQKVALRFGARGALTKPFSLQQLLGVIQAEIGEPAPRPDSTDMPRR